MGQLSSRSLSETRILMCLCSKLFKKTTSDEDFHKKLASLQQEERVPAETSEKARERLLKNHQGNGSIRRDEQDRLFPSRQNIDNGYLRKLGMTKQELYRLKASWKAVHREVAKAGLEMFMIAFRRDGEMMQFFVKHGMLVSEEMDEHDDLRENVKLQKHAEGVMRVLDNIILNIDNEKKVHSLLQTFEEPFLASVRMTLEDRYSDEIGKIYERVIHYILTGMEEYFKAGPKVDLIMDDCKRGDGYE